jgi:hypothetical protein
MLDFVLKPKHVRLKLHIEITQNLVVTDGLRPLLLEHFLPNLKKKNELRSTERNLELLAVKLEGHWSDPMDRPPSIFRWRFCTSPSSALLYVPLQASYHLDLLCSYRCLLLFIVFYLRSDCTKLAWRRDNRKRVTSACVNTIHVISFRGLIITTPQKEATLITARNGTRILVWRDNKHAMKRTPNMAAARY